MAKVTRTDCTVYWTQMKPVSTQSGIANDSSVESKGTTATESLAEPPTRTASAKVKSDSLTDTHLLPC